MAADRARSNLLVRVALFAFPRARRERIAPEMLAVFQARRSDVRNRRGALVAALFTIREALGFALAGLRARSSTDPRPSTSNPRLSTLDRGLSTLDSLRLDLRFALRTLRSSPGFSAVAVLVLALGIASSVAIFSVVDAVMLRPLPLHEPDRLVALWEENAQRGWVRGQVAPANYLDWKEQLRSFDDMAGFEDYYSGVIVGGPGEAVRVQANFVTGNFFDVLGVRPLHGESLADAQTWSDGERAVVLSERLWRTVYGADPAVVGGTIEVNRTPVKVAGVMPASLRFPREDTDIWVPIGWKRTDVSQIWFRRAHSLRVVARLAPSASPDAARTELRALMSRLEREYPETNIGMQAGLAPLRSWLVGDTRDPLLALIGAVSLLLLIACVNLANLLLVRGVARQREFAVRGALGALPRRLARQLLTETLVLAAVGGAAGVGLGALAIRVLAGRLPAGIETVEPIALDGRVLLFALAATVVSAVLFGVMPALRGARADFALALKGRNATGRSSLRTVNMLVMAEVGLALVLVTSAALLARSAWRLGQVDPGFDSENVLAFSFTLPSNGYRNRDAVLAFQSGLLDRLRALPGVTAAGAGAQLPLTGKGWGSDFTTSRWMGEGRHGSDVRHREIHAGFLETLRVPVLRGRMFDERDHTNAELVVLINQAMADRYFADEDPIGQRIAFDAVPDSNSVWRTIVGVVGNVRQFDLRGEAQPEFIAPATQDWGRMLIFVVRSAEDPTRLVPAIRTVVTEMDAGLPIFDIRTVDNVRATAYARERFVVALFTGFAMLALLLAIVGVYGIAAQAVRTRTHEIGIRMALGADRRDVFGMVVWRVMRLVIAGVAIGLAAALAGTRMLDGLLFGITHTDAATFTAAALTLAATALLACTLPARRATKADPILALRGD